VCCSACAKELVAGLLRPRLFPFGKLSKLKSAAHCDIFIRFFRTPKFRPGSLADIRRETKGGIVLPPYVCTHVHILYTKTEIKLRKKHNNGCPLAEPEFLPAIA
jgi:hypothetical protein